MKLTLHTETTIDSAHQLKGYNGKCSQMHGHTWKVELWFRGDSKDCDNVGILVDFGIVKKLKELLDHKIINEVIQVNPTAENLTQEIYQWLKLNVNKANRNIEIKVRVYETAVDKKTYCEGGDF